MPYHPQFVVWRATNIADTLFLIGNCLQLAIGGLSASVLQAEAGVITVSCSVVLLWKDHLT